MIVNRLITNRFILICLTGLLGGLTLGANSTNQTSPEIHYFQIEPVLKPYLDNIIQKVEPESWPKTNFLRTSPRIDKSLLPNPELVTRENIGLGLAVFADRALIGGGGKWSWDHLVKNPEPLPTDFPEEQKKWLLEHIPSRIRKDPNLVKEYMDRKLNYYRKSKMHRVVGSIELDVCVSPNSQAACEYLIYYHRGYSIPEESIAIQFSESKRLKDLGTIAFYEHWKGFEKIMLVRDNIAVVIDAHGELAKEALPLAKKIDALIQKQPALTYQELLARRPSIMIDANATKSKMTLETTTSYNVTAPAGQEIVDIKAYIDDQSAPIRDGKIHIINKKGKVKVKVIATTSELLTNTFEREVDIPE